MNKFKIRVKNCNPVDTGRKLYVQFTSCVYGQLRVYKYSEQQFLRILLHSFSVASLYPLQKTNKWTFTENLFHRLIFMPLSSFDTPWKHQKTSGFRMFSGVSKEISGMKWVNVIWKHLQIMDYSFCEWLTTY